MDNKRIDIFYDQVDKACMILYNELKIDYIKALTRVSRDLVHELDEMGLSDEAITDLNDIYNYQDRNAEKSQQTKRIEEIHLSTPIFTILPKRTAVTESSAPTSI